MVGRKKKVEERSTLETYEKRKEALLRVRSIVEKQSSARSSEWNRVSFLGASANLQKENEGGVSSHLLVHLAFSAALLFLLHVRPL